MTSKQLTDQYGSTATLYQGDCLELMKDISDSSVDMILCDLPYGTTQNKWDSVIPFGKLWEQYNRICTGAIVLTAAQPFTSLLIVSNLEMFKYQWVWEKSQAVGHLNAWRRPMRQHEDIAVFSKLTPPYFPIITDKPKENQRPVTTRTKQSDNYGNCDLNIHKCPSDKSMPRSILKFSNAQNTVHPTQKPVALMEYLIKTYTNEGQTVMDNCMGSGTTGVACINTKRNFIGMEQESKYFDISVSRISATIDDQKPDLTLEFS